MGNGNNVSENKEMKMICMESLNLGWLRKARRKKKMTTDMAAKVIGKDRSTIWRYETGQTPINVDVLFKLLHLYEVSVVDVVMVSKGAGENARI